MRLKLSIMIFCMFLLLSITVSMLFYHISADAEIKTLIGAEQEILSFEKLIIDEHLKNLEMDVKYLAVQRKTIAFVQSRYNPAYDPSALYISFLKRKDTFSSVQIIDSSGKEMLRINVDNGKIVRLKSGALQEKGNRYYFQEIMNSNPSSVYVSNFDFDRDDGKSVFFPRSALRLGKVLLDREGNRQAVIVLTYSGDSLFKLINNEDFSHAGLLSLINSENKIFSEEKGTIQFNAELGNFITSSEWDALDSNLEGYVAGDFGIIFYKHFTIPGSIEKQKAALVSFVTPERRGILLHPVRVRALYVLFGLILLSLISSLLMASYLAKKKVVNEELLILRAAVSQSANSIIITDTEGVIKFVNAAFERLTGYTFDELEGVNPRVLKSGHQNEDYYIDLWNTIKSGRVWSGIFLNKRKDEMTYWESATISPVYDKKKRIRYYIAVKEDITEKRRIENEFKLEHEQLVLAKLDAESAREEAEKANQLKSAFLANISHEIRTPMNAILGFAQMLVKNETDKKKTKKLKIIIESGKKLLVLINGILNLSEVESGTVEVHLSEMSIRNVTMGIVQLLQREAKEKNLDLDFEIAEEVPPLIIGDPELIRQILMNIVSNAIKFTHTGSVKIHVSRDGDFLNISIRDTGIGIPENTLETIFEPFEQQDSSTSRQYGGAGLGLALSKRYAELMGGDITVSSIPGTGTRFICRLPFTMVPDDSLTMKNRSRQGTLPLFPLWKDRLEKDGNLLVDVLYETVEKLPGDIEELTSAINGGDIIQAKRIVHTLKGSTGSLKMFEVHDKLKEIESFLYSESDHEKEMLSLTGNLLLLAESNRTVSRKTGNRINSFGKQENEPPLYRILAADDDESVRNVIAAFLKYSGLDADFAADGEEVLEKLTNGSYDILLIDLQMPVLDGIETVKEIRRKSIYDGLYIIAVTGNECGSRREEFRKWGFDDCISKPLKLEPFIKKIHKKTSGSNGAWIIKDLEPLVKTFNADKVINVARKIELYDDDIFLKRISRRIRNIAESYDSNALLVLIKELKEKYGNEE